MSLPARILDDLMVCRTRAWFTLTKVVSRKNPYHRGAISRQNEFLEQLEKMFIEIGGDNVLTSGYEWPVEATIYCENLRFRLRGKVDLFLLLNLGGLRGKTSPMLRGLAVEVAETEVKYILSKQYLLPRLFFYSSALYLDLGVPTASLYIPLTPAGKLKGILLVGSRRNYSKNYGKNSEFKIPSFSKLCRSLGLLKDYESPPQPKGMISCHDCLYRNKCPYVRI